MTAGSDKKTATVQSKLALVQSELKVPKSEEGRFGKHRNVEGILEAVKPLLTKHGLTIVLDSKIVEVGGRNYIKATAYISDGEGVISATAYAWEGDISRGLDAPQVTGSASSYARKYALGGLFAIDDSKDPDSHKTAPDPSKELQTKPPVEIKQKDDDPATPAQKNQLKNMMLAKEMEPDEMAMLVETVLGTPKVVSFKDYKAILGELEGPTNAKAN